MRILVTVLRNQALQKPSPPISSTDPRVNDPFSARQKLESFHPAMVFQGSQFLRPNKDTATYLAADLKTPRLNDIHQHLWLAGLPNAARPLHRQKLLGRTISITEDPDEHLVWFETRIFIKPLPDFLLVYDYWNDNLCSDLELRKSACGFLLSYAWLVSYKSDLDIAKECGLLSKDIEWANWVEFLDAFLDNINLETLGDVNKRYKYGELRLSRLNSIYRLAPPAYSFRNFIRGYKSGSTWHEAFFQRHFKWILAAFALLTVLLSALQVGLATTRLQGYATFQTASYGFATASLVAIVAGVVLLFFVWLVLFFYHLLSAWTNNREVDRRRSRSVSSP